MKLKNFDDAHPVEIYTVLNYKEDVIYDKDFKVIDVVHGKKDIFKIINIEVKKDIEFWQIKSLLKNQPIGWINAKNHLKMLNTVSQKFQVHADKISSELNNSLGLTFSFDENFFYTKKYIAEYNGRLYFGLFEGKDFAGLVNIDALNLGEIEPVKFEFIEKSAYIYETPDMKFPIRINLERNDLIANSFFTFKDKKILGFTFGDKNFWVNLEDVFIDYDSITFIENINPKDSLREFYINQIRADKNSYYSLNKNFYTTSKINKIINDFVEYESSSKIYKQLDLNIGIICDEFMYYSLKDSANFTYLTYQEDIKVDNSLDFILIVSSWRGIDGSWEYVANPKGTKREVLIQLIKKYNDASIPTVFYSKEDPVNYDRFISIAQECKFIYTSAIEIVDKYKEDTGNENVDYLQFSINPMYHNPLGKNLENLLSKNQVVFAGSWMKKYPVRNIETKEIFDGVLCSKADLNIVDRNFNRNLVDYQFPYFYSPYVSETIDHEKLMKLHKATTWGINLNSVKYSNTMFANRIYELQAMGNLILSNYSMGVNNKFPHIFLVHDKQDVVSVINKTTDKERLETIAKSISDVMLNHSAFHRVKKIAKNLGYDTSFKKPKILVVGRDETTRNSFDIQFYENKEFILESDLTDYNELNDIDFISYFKEDTIYEEHYLSNLLSGYAYTNSDVVEMSSKKEYTYKNTTNYDKYFSLIDKNKLGVEKLILNIPQTEIFNVHDFNNNEDEKVLSVIIPIHNNGKYLEDKCFRSLRRSSIFNKMQIIMIDDGSTDPETIQIINRIRRRYSNITYHKFQYGSGSASRPRNKGIQLANTKYITFLDPDNEASGDGYKKLLDEMKNNDKLDLVLGNVIKEDNKKKSLLNYHYYVLVNNDGNNIVYNPKEFLIKANLRAHSIQAMIVKTNILKENKLQMVEGAAGQDTMFFQEVLLHSNSFKSIPDIIHVYYAAVDGSVTTTIQKSFFEKYLVLEKERVPFLKKHGLFNIYVNERLPYYYVNWYHKRLTSVSESDYEEVLKILSKIVNMYIDNYNFEDENFNVILRETFNIKK